MTPLDQLLQVDNTHKEIVNVIRLVSLLLLLLIALSCSKESDMIYSPYIHKEYIYKGQLHCHSNKSDGNGTPAQVFNAYKKLGYDFVCLTDHDIFAGENATPKPDGTELFSLAGVEETHAEHIGRIGSDVGIVSDNAQVIINDIVAKGGVANICHPHLVGMDATALLAITGYDLMEIKNYMVEDVWNSYKGTDESLWDQVLASGRLVWGVAVDDTHVMDRDLGFTSVMVYANSKDEILDSLRNGNFYTMEKDGSLINKIDLVGTTLYIEVSDASDFDFIGSGGVFQKNIGVKSTYYKITGEEGYLRVRITNSASGKHTWMQPMITGLNSSMVNYNVKILSETGRVVIGSPIATLFEDGRVGVITGVS